MTKQIDSADEGLPDSELLRRLVEGADRNPSVQERDIYYHRVMACFLEEQLAELGIDAFKRDGNPLSAWEVWLHCRKASLPVPEPVLKYLDGVAEALLALSARPPVPVAPALQKALGLQKGERHASHLSNYRRTERNTAIASAVDNAIAELTEGKRISQESAFEQVADEWNVSTAVVKRAWRAERLPVTSPRNGGKSAIKAKTGKSY